MNFKISDSEAFIGTTTLSDLASYTRVGASARLAVRVHHNPSGPATDYVVFKDGKVWHETKTVSEAVSAYNILLGQLEIES